MPYLPRYVSDYAGLASIYQRGGEQLAELSLRRGATTAATLDRLASIFSGYHEVERQKKATAAATALRAQERAEDRSEKQKDRDERALERKADKELRQQEQDRGAARYAVDNTEPGPVDTALAQFARRFPETAARFSSRSTLPATVTPGAVGAVAQEPEQFSVLEPNADQVARSRAETAAAAREAAAEARAATDDQRQSAALAESIRHNRASEGIARTNAFARPDNTQEFVIRNGVVTPIRKGQAQSGDVPYSAEAMQGVGGEASDARAQRSAAALNSIDQLKKLAPQRLPGLPGMVQGAAASVAGAAGYNTGARQYNALLGPTAMQMAVAIQGAAGLSNAEREVMKGMLGSIATMDYESQMALLEKASQLIRTGADVSLIKVKDETTGDLVDRWVPKRSRMPGSVTIGAQPGAVPAFEPGRIRPACFCVPKEADSKWPANWPRRGARSIRGRTTASRIRNLKRRSSPSSPARTTTSLRMHRLPHPFGQRANGPASRAQLIRIDAPGGAFPRVRGFVAGSLQGAADLAEGVKAGAASTVFHGGDLIRRGLGMERVIEQPEVQNLITPPSTGAGKTGFFLEQGAEFAVPLTRVSKVAQGMGLGKRMAIDAAASGAVAGVQSGGDPAAITTGTVLGGAVPAVGAGLRLVGGAVQRGAAGAREGGIGGALAGAVRTAAPLDSNFMLFQGLKPRNSRTNFMKSLERAVPEIKASEEALGKSIESIDDLLNATDLAKKRIRAHYDAIAGPKRGIGTTVDLSSVADDMVKRIPSKLRLEHPGQVEAIEQMAAKYRRAFTLEEAEQLLKETNGELEAFYNKFPLGQRRALVADPEAMRLDAQAKGLRDAIYRTLDGPNQPAGARALNKVYGDLLEIEDTAVRRSNVAKRQQPESLNEQFSKARAAGDVARGAWRIAHGDLTGAADIAAAKATRDTAKYLKDQQTTDALIKRAFAGVTKKPGVYATPAPPRPVRGLLEEGAVPLGSGPDPSYVRGVPAQYATPDRRALPPAREVRTGAAVPDDSYVRSIPGEYVVPERRTLPPARTVHKAGPGPDSSGPIPPTLPEHYVREQEAHKAFDEAFPASPATSSQAPDVAERSFMLRWLADDLNEMRFERGGSTRGQRDAAMENWRPGDPDHLKHGFVPAGHAAGTPTQEMFHAAGIKGSRGEIVRKLNAAISGKKTTPKIEALADAMRQAWDGTNFDWQLVSDETIAKLGIRRKDFRSPILSPNRDDMPEIYARLFGGHE